MKTATLAIAATLALSAGAQAQGTYPEKPVRIIVDFDGTVYWDGAVVNRQEMEQQMMVAAKRDPQPEIHIEPHKLAKYSVVAGVMASAQRLGLEKLGVLGGTQ